ncbi:probable serine/threonine-protein kinase WNK6 [Chenopodium quinoa]|uniref:non-specific serine/threonine protein kinase n=1 Tax=Chenopodium quinoa TaxID=63459 RepID=A0A803LEP9_CHEQI|nr:probable serine/threonine-protein kinase WNK6 [Chenopodium quinoa]
MSGSSSSQAMLRCGVAEADSTGRYERYHMSISNPHPMKIVYEGIDQLTGIKINWCKIVLGLSTEEEETRKKKFNDYCDEPWLLQSLQHENIIICYNYWPDDTHTLNTVHMITEAFSSENLRDYSLKYNLVGNKQAIRRWCKQILSALDYLHSQNPPIMHRDVSLENIFINGNTGKVKLGEFGAAIKLEEGADLQEFAGAPEYMAPEIFQLDYNQKADIYSFGMCVIQMMSRDKIYSECRNRVEIQSRVQRGVKPDALERVTDTEIRRFIDFCLAGQNDRPAASDLLRNPLILSEDGFQGIQTGKSSSGSADADERQCEMTLGGGGGGSKPLWRQKLSKLSSIMRKKK